MEIELNTHIEKVFVYQQGARIVRVGKCNLSKGSHKILLKKMTKFLDKNSVRIKGTGNGKILNIGIEKHTSPISKNEEIANIRQKIKEVKKKHHEIEFLLEFMDESTENLRNFGKEFYSRAPIYLIRDKMDFNKISDTDNFITKEIQQKIKEKQNAEEKKRELTEELNRLQRELQLLSRTSSFEEYWEIIISLDVVKDGEFIFEIQFQVNKASWIPFYDINLLENQAEIKLMANVFNYMEESWENVHLEISSANLRPVKIIEPHPYIIRELKPEPIVKPRPARSGLKYMKKRAMAPLPEAAPEEEALGAGTDRFALDMIKEKPAPKLEEVHAEISENLGVQSYLIPEKVSIRSDKQPHPIILSVFSLNTKKGYFWSSAAPDLLVIKDTISNGEQLILPGKAKVYEQNEFISEISLPLIAPFETIDIGTRKSHDLRIDKKLVNRQSAKEGILKGKVAKFYEYEIKIKIFRHRSNILKIMDRIPHSDSEKIKIGKINFSEPPKKQELGVITWEIDMEKLKNQEEKIIKYSFEVTWEKDIKITPPLP
ncbi:MAG: mucoidy inhibitor MuiA family protein [Candidatus Lokiarchaeota archaeon]|nr:mucoidy inhibitor MuiA family protein [Candidatus Harpocratesius repetitus]